jgi:hypothetical protein
MIMLRGSASSSGVISVITKISGIMIIKNIKKGEGGVKTTDQRPLTVPILHEASKPYHFRYAHAERRTRR